MNAPDARPDDLPQFTGYAEMPDDDFEIAWLALPQSKKDALPQDIKKHCIDRYVRLHRYVSEGAARLAKIQARSEPQTPATVPVSTDDGDVALRGTDDALEANVAESISNNPTEDNVALAFALLYRNDLLYSHRHGHWYVWDGKRWKGERTGLAREYARRLARKANREGKTNIARAGFSRGVETFAQSDRVFSRIGDEFDRDNCRLNMPAGTLDLRTMTMQAHRQDDMITMITAVSPTPDGGAAFLKFMHEITCGDTALIDFLQRALGACLSGAIEDHWMMFWWGAGRNGKNTLGDLVLYILGDYAKKISSDTLMSHGSNAPHPTELANLQGVRLAMASEIPEGAHWNESRIKELTGDAMLSARFMRQDFFEFLRTFKLLIFGNNRPQLRATDPAIQSRMKIVPFAADFSGRENPDLPAELRAEAGYVLNWLIEGHTKWLAGGKILRNCDAVQRESDDYFAAQSTPEMWFGERLEIIENDDRPSYQCPKASVLYRDFKEWKEARGEIPISQTRWGEAMQRRFTRLHSNGMRYRGIELKPTY